ncbi:MAG: hypothetical protein HWN66_21135 [Candidatus Helarchaeota archaeon]|nr:hypothetical protein [Candidatus Helarchaeota archaeon]
MTKGGRIAGGVLAIVGGALLLIAAFTVFAIIAAAKLAGFDQEAMLFTIQMIVTLMCGVLALVGGILAVVDKSVGGILALVGGALATVGMFIPIGSLGILPINFAISFIFVDPFLALAGGITAVAVGSEL